MGNVAIRARNLSKKYAVVGARRHDTLRDQVVDTVSRLWAGGGDDTSTQKGGHRARESDQNSLWAINDVSFEVHHGELVGVIGRNGAGKSTLLKLLARITEPTNGCAELYGRVGSLLEVGTGFDRELSGRENIQLSGALLGMKWAEIKRKFDEIVAFADVEKFIDTPVKHYSSGMYTRLAFAVAAHLEPEILLVDEVLAVGDGAFQTKCLGKMDEVRREGRTVLFVTHNMAMIENLCPRTILLAGGSVTIDGPTGEVIHAYIRGLAAHSNAPLVDRTDRKGLGEILVTNVEFLNRGGDPISYAASGQELVIRMQYQCKRPEVFRNCRVSVSIHKDEQPYFLMSTELVNNSRLDLSGAGSIDFIVPELPLSGGEYYVNPFIESNQVIQDWVIRAAPLSVIDGDFYGTGRNYPAGWQGKCVLVKYRWNQRAAGDSYVGA